MLYNFSRIFYGMLLDLKDVPFAQQVFQEGKTVFTQEQFGMDIDMCYDFTEKTKYFIYIIPTLQIIKGNGIKEIEIKPASTLWGNILYNFCELYEITPSQPNWFITNEVWQE